MGQVLRRQFLMAAGALLAAPLARAQAPAKLPTMGFLSPHPKSPTTLLRKRFGELGWIEDKTYRVEFAYAGGKLDRLPELAAMLAAKKVDVIWALGPEAALAAARATKTIPIVFWGVAFPVEQGLVDSLAKPGRNVTGVAWSSSPGIGAKRLQLLREIAPDATRLASLSVPSLVRTVEGGRVTIAGGDVDAASRDLGFEVRRFKVLNDADLEPAFAAIMKWGAHALHDSGSPLSYRNMNRIVDFANRNRLPAIYTFRDYVVAGGLISYAIDWRRTAVRSYDYVDKILRGAKPADLPVELPQKYELGVNRKTAKALGLTIPPSILLSADHVIE